MNVNNIFLVLNHAGVKEAQVNQSINAIDICFVRTLTLIISSSIILKKNKLNICNFNQFTRNVKLFIALRCIIGTIGFTTIVLALLYIPLYLVGIIQNTMPFWAAIIGYCMNREKVLKLEILCIIGCFAGLVVLMLHKKEQSE